MTRRDAVKQVTAGAIVAGAGATLAQGQEERRINQREEAARLKGLELVPPEEVKGLERKTEPFKLRVGIDRPDRAQAGAVDREAMEQHKADYTPLGTKPMETAWSAPQPSLNGLRVQVPGRTEIYLIDLGGYRRWIPDPATYWNLFPDLNNIYKGIDVLNIPLGPQITSGAILTREFGYASVFLIDNFCKRWVTSPAAMDKYHFAWNRVYNVPPVLVDFLPFGPEIS